MWASGQLFLLFSERLIISEGKQKKLASGESRTLRIFLSVNMIVNVKTLICETAHLYICTLSLSFSPRLLPLTFQSEFLRASRQDYTLGICNLWRLRFTPSFSSSPACWWHPVCPFFTFSFFFYDGYNNTNNTALIFIGFLWVVFAHAKMLALLLWLLASREQWLSGVLTIIYNVC